MTETDEYILYNDGTLIIKEGIKILTEQVYSKLKIKKLVLSSSVEEIESYAFYKNGIKEIVFNEKLNKIGKFSFYGNKLENIVLPSNIEVISKGCFQNNRINSLELNDNLKTIEKEAFMGNLIKKLKLNENLKTIEAKAFMKNMISEIEFNDIIECLNDEVFANNKLKELNLKNIKIINNGTFKNNGLKNVNLEKVLFIGDNTFQNNFIENVTFSDGIKMVGKESFNYNLIKTIDLKNIEVIKEDAFCSNKLMFLNFDKVKNIGKEAFSYNNLQFVTLNDDVEYLDHNVFIGNSQINLEFKGKFYNDKELLNYDTYNLIKISKINEMLPLINLSKFKAREIYEMPLDKSIINGIAINYNRFHNLLNLNMNKQSDEYIALFKLGQALGLFNLNNEEYEKSACIFSEFILKHSKKEIKDAFLNINMKKHNQNFNNLITEYLQDFENNSYYFKYLSDIYENLDDIKKFSVKQKEEIIRKTNSLKKKLNTDTYDEFLNFMKKTKKHIFLEDCNKYLDSKLNWSNEIEELNKIKLFLSCYMNENDFNRIIDLYNKSLKIDDQVYFKNIEKNDGDYKYKWLSNKDVTNFILGYKVNCCSKINGNGEDIMVQSIINPKIKNLVVYKNDEIIGKATAFYNDGYILFNNIEIKEQKNIDEKSVLKWFLNGIKDQIKEMNYKGIIINECRIGMARNDLSDVIISEFNIDKNNMLANFNYKGYNGDANDKNYGQAIVYRRK